MEFEGTVRAGFARTALARLGGRLAVLAVVLLALGWTIAGPLNVARHATEHPFRVDYLAYDTAATIIRRDEAASLYDTELQRSVQASRAGNDEPSYLVYLNPPIVGAAFMPLAQVSARTGYALFVGVLALTMALASALIFRVLDGVATRTRWLATICIAGSTTVASALLSGQLTPVVLLIGLGSMVAYRRGRVLEAGLILGLLCIKPHFALAAMLVLLATGQRKMLAGMVATGAAGVLASVALMGSSGVSGYVALLRRSFESPASLYINVNSEQNLLGFSASLFDLYGGPIISIAATMIALVVFVVIVRALRAAPYKGIDRVCYLAALTGAFIVSAAPHVQYYDLALLAFGALFIVRRAEAAPPGVRARFYGALVLLVLWLEVAGVLAGVGMSISFIPLVVFTAMLASWPRVEAWLVAPAGLRRATRQERDEPRLRAA